MQSVFSAVVFMLFLLISLHFSLGEKPAVVQPEADKEVEIATISNAAAIESIEDVDVAQRVQALDETIVIEATVRRAAKTKRAAKAKVDTGDLPDFGAIVDVKQKKEAFFSFIRTYAEEENRKVMADRQRIISIRNDVDANEEDLEWIQVLARRYRMSSEQMMDEVWFDALLMRVDQLPVSMVLAQAANESAWGTSRFARQGNNLFGQWCFSSGCGIVPESRPEGETYEVRRFANVGDSVAAYFLNLNTHPGYEVLRELRRHGRARESFITGLYLAQGLHVYSERGYDYVKEISSMIRYNDLIRYDEQISGIDTSATASQNVRDRSSS